MFAIIILAVTIPAYCVAGFPAIQQGRIVNGSDTDIYEFPFMVSVKGATEFHICGGSIISPRWVMTAGHCIDLEGNDIESYSVQYGVTLITRDGPTISKVDDIIVHELFHPLFLDNDIALMHLVDTLEFSDTVDAVKLPRHYYFARDGADAELIGWGMNGTNGQYQQTLQKVYLKIVSPEVCDRFHQSPIYDFNICAGIPEGGKGQCSGDSGGPLLLDSYQIGIVSWSTKPCTIHPFPGVFTQVAYFREWIRNKTGI